MYIYGYPEILAHVAVHYPPDQQRWLVWHYTNKSTARNAFWQRSHESILCLWGPERGEELPELEVDQIREPYSKHYLASAGKVRKATPSRMAAKGRATRYNAHPKGARPRDVIHVAALAGGAGKSQRVSLCRTCDELVYGSPASTRHRNHDVVTHETQKPMALCERLVKSKINGAGGRVFIPFVGTGSEVVAAARAGAVYAGVDLNPDYIELAKRRVAECTA